MTAPSENRDAYVDLLKRSITNFSYLGGETPFEQFRCVTHYDLKQATWKIDPLARPITLLTKYQLDLVEQSILAVEQRGVPGDFIEAGVWRGGVIILMRAMINAHKITGRKVVAADSFAGIPKNTRALNDPVDTWRDRWIASIDEVKQNIERFGLLDDRIEFVPGLFSHTLRGLAGRKFALMRLDSDSYDSVEESLVYLYPLLSRGGIIIIDDWHLVGCKAAVENYRARHGIREELKVHDGNAYWVKA
jgi:O-methyltransferase